MASEVRMRRIRNKYTGEIREVPDTSALAQAVASRPPDTEKAAMIATTGDPAQTPASMQDSPGFRAFRGANRLVMETAAEAPLRGLAALGLPFAKKAVDRFEEHKRENPLGDAGSIGAGAADFGLMMAPTGTEKFGLPFRIAGEVLKGVGIHQAQNYAKTGDVDGAQAAIEAGATSLMTAAPSFLKKAGVSTLRRSLGIPRKFFRGANKIDLQDALEKKKIPFFGGAESIRDAADKRIMAGDEKLTDLLRREYVETPYHDVANAANRRLMNLEKAGKVDVGTFDASLPAREQAGLNAMNLGKQSGPFQPVMVKGPAWRTLRKRADEAAQYDKTANKIAPPGARWSQLYRDEAENMLAREMRATESAPEYAVVRREMRKDTPLKQAAQDKLERSVGLMDLATGGVLGLPSAHQLAYGNVGNAAALGGMGALTYGLMKTPGGARVLYEAGRGPRSVGGQKLRKAAINLVRSQTFRPEDE